MEYENKVEMFNEFLLKCESQFNKIPQILRFIATYPENFCKLDDFNPLRIDEFNNSQFEWVLSLVAQQA